MEKNIPNQPVFSQEEKDALNGKIPMTLEILSRCFMACFYADNECEYDRIKERFPELTDALGWEKPYVYEHHREVRILCGGYPVDNPTIVQ